MIRNGVKRVENLIWAKNSNFDFFQKLRNFHGSHDFMLGDAKFEGPVLFHLAIDPGTDYHFTEHP